MVKFPPVTAEVKPLAHLLKLADEHDERNIVVAYWGMFLNKNDIVAIFILWSFVTILIICILYLFSS